MLGRPFVFAFTDVGSENSIRTRLQESCLKPLRECCSGSLLRALARARADEVVPPVIFVNL
jgi:hypothetical protein